jgi:ribosomal protein S18 acetylase RimI-like enzyme
MAVPGSTRLLGPQDAPAAAAIDAEARAGDFLPSLGSDFLRVLYSQLLRGESSWGHGLRSPSNELLGFVVGCVDSEQVFRDLSPVRNVPMFLGTARAVLRKPSSLVRMAESLLYTSKESVGDVKAELIVIGTRHDTRGNGVGSRLVGALAAELVRRGIKRYRVTVKEKNEAALRFYARHQFEPASQFRLYGEGWRVLVADPATQIAAASR